MWYDSYMWHRYIDDSYMWYTYIWLIYVTWYRYVLWLIYDVTLTCICDMYVLHIWYYKYDMYVLHMWYVCKSTICRVHTHIYVHMYLKKNRYIRQSHVSRICIRHGTHISESHIYICV